MEDGFRGAVAGWENFYVIVGAGAAALTGLMFVAITLIAESERPRSGEATAAFGTPTIVHFISSLVISAIVVAPFKRVESLSDCLIILALFGVFYSAVAIVRTQRQRDYKPELSDWIWFSILPLATNVALAGCSLYLRADLENALFGVAGVTLGLLLIAMRNAWDTVTFMAMNPEARR